MTVWHILRKDIRLLWRAAAGVVLLYALRLAVDSADIAHRQGLSMASLVRMLSLLAPAILVLIAVQQDAIPGPRQDWLVRPIRRRDLMLSKVAFVLLAITLPFFLADAANGLIIGYPLGVALSAAFAENFRLLFELLVPVLALATLTKNLTEALASLLAVVLAVIFVSFSWLNNAATMNSSISWIPETILWGLVLMGAALVLWTQYYSRRTIRSRWVFCVTLAVALPVQLMPWAPAFAIQERLSSQPDAAKAVRIELQKAAKFTERDGLLATLEVPVKFGGVGPDETLFEDRVVDSHLVEADGSIIPVAQGTIGGHTLSSERDFIQMTMARDRLHSPTARLELDYSLTLFRMIAHQILPRNATTQLEGMGVCVTRTEGVAAEPEVYCRLGRGAALMVWSLEGFPPDGHRSSTWLEDYCPWVGRDPYWRRTILQNTPKNRFEMRAYEPIAHFTRHIAVPLSQIAP